MSLILNLRKLLLVLILKAISPYLNVQKFSDALSLGVLYYNEISAYKLTNLCKQLAIHFAGLAHTKFSKKKKLNISKFYIPLSHLTSKGREGA